MPKKVKIYSTPACVYCVTLKKFLEENNVEYEEINVLEDKEAAEEMIRKSNQMGVPVVEIGEEVVVGFDREKIQSLLNLN